ncbi:MAG: hypothetical protein IKD08_03240 [Alphaproteobacteria bacterium]|nr:hypothetical protein [Alphaproteobacteria bacterium]
MKCIASAVIFSVAFAGNALAFSLQLGSVTPEAYASGIMYSLDAMPIHDGASYALYDVDKSIFQLKDSDQFGNIKNKVSDEKYLPTAPYHSLENLKNVALSYRLPTDIIKEMEKAGKTQYPGEDNTRPSGILWFLPQDNSNKRPGIRQILFNPSEDYTAMEEYEITPIEFDMMKEFREKRGITREGTPLEIAAWFEDKVLLRVGFGRVNDDTIMRKRRTSYLQESIIEALDTVSYVEIRMAEVLDILGYPNAEDGFEKKEPNLMSTLVGDFTYDPVEQRFKGKDESFIGKDMDLNGTIKSNFIARHTFSQLLSVYQQVLAAKLKFLVATMVNSGLPAQSGEKALDSDKLIGPIGKALHNQKILDARRAEEERKKAEENK